MEIIARSTSQLGDAIRRSRRLQRLTQNDLGAKMHVRQATISKLEGGEPGTQLKVLIEALAALELEVVIRPRTKDEAQDLEDLF